jgi:uncharacterized phage-like protein YoqJ
MQEVVCVTGHRSDKLGGYSVDAQKLLFQVAVKVLSVEMPEMVYTGMALGWDQAIARACVKLDIPFVAAVPFKGQELRWNKHAQEIYHMLLKRAKLIQYVSPGGYEPRKMHIRNEWMVDRSEKVLAIWNGSEGGTHNCVKYAYLKQVPVRNYFSEWLAEFRHSPIYKPTGEVPQINRERVMQMALEFAQ